MHNSTYYESIGIRWAMTACGNYTLSGMLILSKEKLLNLVGNKRGLLHAKRKFLLEKRKLLFITKLKSTTKRWRNHRNQLTTCATIMLIVILNPHTAQCYTSPKRDNRTVVGNNVFGALAHISITNKTLVTTPVNILSTGAESQPTDINRLSSTSAVAKGKKRILKSTSLSLEVQTGNEDTGIQNSAIYMTKKRSTDNKGSDKNKKEDIIESSSPSPVLTIHSPSPTFSLIEYASKDPTHRPSPIFTTNSPSLSSSSIQSLSEAPTYSPTLSFTRSPTNGPSYIPSTELTQNPTQKLKKDSITPSNYPTSNFFTEAPTTKTHSLSDNNIHDEDLVEGVEKIHPILRTTDIPAFTLVLSLTTGSDGIIVTLDQSLLLEATKTVMAKSFKSHLSYSKKDHGSTNHDIYAELTIFLSEIVQKNFQFMAMFEGKLSSTEIGDTNLMKDATIDAFEGTSLEFFHMILRDSGNEALASIRSVQLKFGVHDDWPSYQIEEKDFDRTNLSFTVDDRAKSPSEEKEQLSSLYIFGILILIFCGAGLLFRILWQRKRRRTMFVFHEFSDGNPMEWNNSVASSESISDFSGSNRHNVVQKSELPNNIQHVINSEGIEVKKVSSIIDDASCLPRAPTRSDTSSIISEDERSFVIENYESFFPSAAENFQHDKKNTPLALRGGTMFL